MPVSLLIDMQNSFLFLTLHSSFAVLFSKWLRTFRVAFLSPLYEDSERVTVY